MTAALPSARRIGIAGTTVAHGALIVLALLAARHAGAKMPLTYEVNLVAAPAPGTARANIVAPAKSAEPTIKGKPEKTPAKKIPLQAKVSPPAPAAKSRVVPAPGAKPSTGTDVVTLHQEGLAFPFPEYLRGIENAIFARWQHEAFRPGLDVKIAFVISRDGTVDPKSVEVTKRSGNSQFDLDAAAASELATNAKAFGPLPTGWNGASLPIEFDFKQVARGTP